MTIENLPKSTLEDCIEDFRRKDVGTLIYVSATGSTLHGTECPTSDRDYKGIFLPSVEHLILQDAKDFYDYTYQCDGKKNELKFISIQHFLSKVMTMECNAIELLFSMDSNHVKLSGPISKYLRQEAEKLLTRNVSSFWGMAKAEMVRYENKKQRNNHKDIAHGVRSGAQAQQLLDQGKLTFPIPNLNLIRKIKFGEIGLEDAYNLMELQFHTIENPKDSPSDAQKQLKKDLILKLYQLIS